MKTKTTTFKALATLAGATLLLAATVNAGESAPSAKAVVPEAAATMSSLIDPITGELSAGYDSHYMFRGINLGQEAPWVGAEFYVPLAFPTGNYTLTLGAWYVNPTRSVQNAASAGINPRGSLDDELDLYAAVSTTVGVFDVELIYNYYALGPEATAAPNPAASGNPGYGDQSEVGVVLATTVGRFDLGLQYFYNFDAGDQGAPPTVPVFGDFDHYIEPSIGTSFELCDRVALTLNAAAGWWSDQFSHLQYTAALPIQVSETVVFEPYAAYLDDRSSGTLNAYKAGLTNDDFFFGAALSVSF